jgi:hypothetical protein
MTGSGYRHFFRFHLRTLALLVGLLAILSAVIGWHVREGRRKSEIVAKMRSWGGRVEMFESTNYPGSHLLRVVFGTAYVDGVETVDLSGRSTHPDSASYPYPEYASRDEAGQECTSSKRKHICRKLGVRDRHLSCIAEFPRVKNLGLYDTAISDRGLRLLSKLEHLELLDLADTAVSCEGLLECRSLTNLRTLRVLNTELSDDVALELFPKLKSLETLDASGTGISDASIAALSHCRHLSHLDIRGTRVTASSVPVLGKFKKLELLRVSDTRIAGTDLGALRSEMPELLILN